MKDKNDVLNVLVGELDLIQKEVFSIEAKRNSKDKVMDAYIRIAVVKDMLKRVALKQNKKWSWLNSVPFFT